MRTPAEAQRDFAQLMKPLAEAVSRLSPLESTRANQIVSKVVPLFEHVLKTSTEDMERKVTIDIVRTQLTELERLFSGQKMLFASEAEKGARGAKIALRYVEALSSGLEDVFKELFDILDDMEAFIQADMLRELGVKPPPAPARKRVKAPRTYAQAQDAILRELASRGWTVKNHLKIPHATNPDGTFRYWFKPQAIYASWGSGVKDFGEARSVFFRDYRLVETGAFVDGLDTYARRRVR